jgi:hypothetical protein
LHANDFAHAKCSEVSVLARGDSSCNDACRVPYFRYVEIGNQSPSITVSPISIPNPDNSSILPRDGNVAGNGSLIVDFSQDADDIIMVTYAASGSGKLGPAFTEARNWTGAWLDSSNGLLDFPVLLESFDT